uniref:Uncharacterized protein MANES_11G120800 n=1 Tax=Rhizophora mucronata TaxID=61149 RepID=A0A2P2LIJ3_RHIMU
MGRKKKKGGGAGRGGRRSKGRTALKDYSSGSVDGGELLSEEITALCAIFQEDCKIVSESSPQITIKLRPYLKDAGNEDLDVSALLLVRCLPGYPYKCPKLHIIPEKGLTKSDADKLLSLLCDQANSNAREGRVMIYNLVEAAQEFLSEIVPEPLLPESVLHSTMDGSGQLYQDISVSRNRSCSSRGPFIFVFLDLFSGCGESWHWGIAVDDNRGTSSSLKSHLKDGSEIEYGMLEKPLTLKVTKQGPLVSSITKLDTLKEEGEEDDDKSVSSSDSSRSPMKESMGNDLKGKKDILLDDHRGAGVDDGDIESEPWDLMSSSSLGHDQTFQNIRKDLIMVHLLHLACTSKRALANALPQITTELCNLGLLSESMRDFASKPSPIFSKTFDNIFHCDMVF